MNKRLNVGVIGLGVGSYHLNNLINNKYVNVISVCDFDKKKIKKIKLKYPSIHTSTDSDVLLNNKIIDFVCIASYDNHHCTQVLKAIKNKKHVFVEKPICTNYSEYNKIKKALKNNYKIKISSNFVLRRSPQFLKLKDMIQKKKFGKIYLISGEYNYGRIKKIITGWRGKIPIYSVTHGGAIHIIDLALSLIKKRPIKVVALGNNISTKNTNFKNNDITSSCIEFDDKMIFNVVSNFGCVMPHHHTFKVYGTKLTFIQEFDNVKIFESRSADKKIVKLSKYYSNSDKKIILEDFINSIVKNKKPIVDRNDVMNSMAISLAIDKSIASKKPEKIKY
jgi:predicted dehydrogenase